METEGERLARLEVRMDESVKDRDLLHQDLSEIKNDVHTIKEEIQSHLGFFKGAGFILTALAAAIGAAVMALWNKLN